MLKEYDPKLNGFSFSNREYTTVFKGKCRRPSVDEVNIDRSCLLGRLLRFFIRLLVPIIYSRIHGYGHCQGMCLASKYLYEHPDKVPNNRDVAYRLTLTEAYDVIEYWTNRVLLDPSYWITGLKLFLKIISVRKEVLKAMRIIGRGEPVPLFLRDPFKWNILRDTGCHLVLAYSYRNTGKYIVFRAYDPNFPGRSIAIIVDRDNWHVRVPAYNGIYNFMLVSTYIHGT